MTIRISWGYRVLDYSSSFFVVFIIGSTILGARGIRESRGVEVSIWVLLLCWIILWGMAALAVIPMIRFTFHQKITLKEKSITIWDLIYGINRAPSAKENNFWNRQLVRSMEFTLDFERVEAAVFGYRDSVIEYCRKTDNRGFIKNLNEIKNLQLGTSGYRPHLFDNFLVFLENNGSFTAIGTDYFSKKQVLLLLENLMGRGVRVVKC